MINVGISWSKSETIGLSINGYKATIALILESKLATSWAPPPPFEKPPT